RTAAWPRARAAAPGARAAASQEAFREAAGAALPGRDPVAPRDRRAGIEEAIGGGGAPGPDELAAGVAAGPDHQPLVGDVVGRTGGDDALDLLAHHVDRGELVEPGQRVLEHAPTLGRKRRREAGRGEPGEDQPRLLLECDPRRRAFGGA